MSLPRRLRILGKTYKVIVQRKNGADYGETRSSACEIEVSASQADDQMRDTILHEAMHAVDHEMHCHLKEGQVRRMATGLLALFRDNPDLVRFLTE